MCDFLEHLLVQHFTKVVTFDGSHNSKIQHVKKLNESWSFCTQFTTIRKDGILSHAFAPYILFYNKKKSSSNQKICNTEKGWIYTDSEFQYNIFTKGFEIITIFTEDFEIITMFTEDLEIITMFTEDLEIITIFTEDFEIVTMFTEDLEIITIFREDFEIVTMVSEDSEIITIFTEHQNAFSPYEKWTGRPAPQGWKNHSNYLWYEKAAVSRPCIWVMFLLAVIFIIFDQSMLCQV